MDFKQLKVLSALPEQELTSRLVSLFRCVLEYHDWGKGMSPFTWQNLREREDGLLYLADITETELTDDVMERNLQDYAAIIYCVTTRQKSAESMEWDAGRKIKPAVLREIVLTICGRNYSVKPLLKKLRLRYVDDEQFFSGYTTVDEKEGDDAYAQAERIRMARESDKEYQAHQAVYTAAMKRKFGGQPRPWHRNKWVLLAFIVVNILVYLVFGGRNRFIRTDTDYKRLQQSVYHRIPMQSLPLKPTQPPKAPTPHVPQFDR